MQDLAFRLYAVFARLPFPRSYLGKILLTVSVGAHFPLLTMVIYFLFSQLPAFGSVLPVLTVALLATLVGTAATLYALYALLAPVRLASRALRDYVARETVPNLPTAYPDEAGQLMADIQHTISHLNSLVASLEKTAMFDHLTATYNRYSGEKRLKEDLARARREGGKLSLAMIDIDDFKRINDLYGHDAGDRCLKHVAGVVSENIREGDWIARWGGDEFLIVVFGTGASTAGKVFARVRGDLHAKPVRTRHGEEFIATFSAGICEFSSGEDAATLLERADVALYRAKRAGKDGVAFYSSEATP